MPKQIRPLKNNTKIEGYWESEVNANTYRYIITQFIARGGSGIVYQANRDDGKRMTPVVLKEYYPINRSNIENEYYRYGGVIVKKGEEDCPYCSVYLEEAEKELDNSRGCSSGKLNSKIGYINKVISASLIQEPDEDMPYSYNGQSLGVFSEMTAFECMLSLPDLVNNLKTELQRPNVPIKKKDDLKLFLSEDLTHLSAYGILKVIQAISVTIGSVHKNDWVHRDIKPENLLFENEPMADFLSGIVTIIDFASAKPLIGDTEPKHADIGEPPYTEGTTLGYQPPEIGELPIEDYEYLGWTVQSDIYQIGCVLYYLLCNSFPPNEIVDNNPVKIAEVLKGYDLSEEACNVISKIISKSIAFNPKTRYVTAEDFKDDIKEAMTQTSPSADIVNWYREEKKADYEVLFGLIDKIEENSIDAEEESNLENYDKENLEQICMSFHVRGQYPLCAKYGRRYLTILKGLGKEEINVKPLILSTIGFCIWKTSRDESAKQLIKESLRFCEASDTDILLSIYTLIYVAEAEDNGICASNVFEIEEVLEQIEALLDNMEKDDTYYRFFCDHCIHRSRLAAFLRDYSQSCEYINQAIKTTEMIKDKDSRLLQLEGVMGQDITVLLQMGQYEACIDVGKSKVRLLRDIDSINNDKTQAMYSLAHTCYSIAYAYYFGLEEPEEAAFYSMMAIEIYNDLNVKLPMIYREYLIKSITLGNAICEGEEGKNISELKEKLVKFIVPKPKIEPLRKEEKAQKREEDFFEKNICRGLRLRANDETIPKHFRPIYKKDISDKIIDSILNSYAEDIEKDDIVAVMEPYRIRTGKKGIVFTKKGICGSCFHSYGLVPYEKIESMTETKPGRVGVTYTNKQYEEIDFPASEVLVYIMKRD